MSLALITMILGTRNGEEEANQATRTTKEHKPIFSQVLRTRIELGTFDLIGGFDLCLGVLCIALVLNEEY
jgi:hypothetical protein